MPRIAAPKAFESLPEMSISGAKQTIIVRVLYHGHCFDGAASAAFFSRFIVSAIHANAEFRYLGLGHHASQMFDPGLFDGDENAIVDFKYSSNPRLTWWFDHHQSAFLTAQDAEHFRRDTSGCKLYDPSYKSCTSFIADVARNRFGFQAPDLDDLVHWSLVIDGAQYPDARTAVELAAPALKLALVIEAAKASDIVPKIIGWMQRRPLAHIIAEPEIQELYKPLYARHLLALDIIGKQAQQESGVVFFDLSDQDIEGYNKFIPYYLFPKATYAVSISHSAFRTKVSVAANPWVSDELKHNLAVICERYGGGGHGRVGAVSLQPDARDQARVVAATIVDELKA